MDARPADRPRRYFALTFLASVALWGAGGYLSFQSRKGAISAALMLAGLMAPLALSLWMMATTSPRPVARVRARPGRGEAPRHAG